MGGFAFLLDAATLFISKEFLLPETADISLYIAVTMGFIVGFISNYILSFIFVFTAAEQRQKSKSVQTMVGFLFVGIIGLLLNWLGMYICVNVLGFCYMFAKIIIAGIVLIWNYFGKKLYLMMVKK